MVARKLRANLVERVAPNGHGSLRKRKVVGSEGHGGHESFQIRSALRLPIQGKRALPLGYHRHEIKLTILVLCAHPEVCNARAFANELQTGRMPERSLGREKPHALHDIGLAYRVRADDNR